MKKYTVEKYEKHFDTFYPGDLFPENKLAEIYYMEAKPYEPIAEEKFDSKKEAFARFDDMKNGCKSYLHNRNGSCCEYHVEWLWLIEWLYDDDDDLPEEDRYICGSLIKCFSEELEVK